MNRKGFTLVELLATIVILTAVMTIGAVSIVGIINKSRDKNYDLLIKNIKTAAEEYYQECRFSRNEAIDDVCKYNDNNQLRLVDFVTYGYLKGNDKEDAKYDENGKITNDSYKYKIVNPKDKESIGECGIKVSYSDGVVVVSPITGTGNASCPTDCDYNPEGSNCQNNG